MFDWHRDRFELGQDVPSKKLAFVEMGVAGKDKGAHSDLHIAVNLGHNLLRITDQSGGTTRASASDACPKMWFDITFLICTLTGLRLQRNAQAFGILRTVANFYADEAKASGSCPT